MGITTSSLGQAAQDAQAKIKNAMSAAPPDIAKDATVMDWADKPGGAMKELKNGTNGWVCYPSSPTTIGGQAVGEDPMCLDKQWQDWASAWMNKRDPKITAVGIGYMLQGDRGASNTDPFATGPTAGNQWIRSGPHIMVLVPDPKQLEGVPTDPKAGGPFVMWKGTPYAHIMVPVAPMPR